MEWVRIHPFIQNWPGGGSPATFDISADENGSVVVELAWDPQALAAPSASYAPLRYYNSSVAANITYKTDRGATKTITLPAQSIQLVGNHATWAIPQALWDGYVEETLKTLNRPPTTTFARQLYYRVRATAPGASQARNWPPDEFLKGPSASAAPRIGILPISATPSSLVIADQEALNAMASTTVWSAMASGIVRALWASLPDSDPGRQSLVQIFAHPTYRGLDVRARAAVLTLWLYAGKDSRLRLPQLLDRNAVTGSNVVTPVVAKTDLRGGKTLVQNLLALLDISPHPDLLTATSKEHLLDDVITEILDPNGQVNQGAAGTCSPTSIQTLAITVNPAEYARLQVGWLSAAGKATLADGNVADVPAGVFKIANYATVPAGSFLVRTFSELAFQAAMLKYAQGSRFPALTGTPANMNQIFQATIAGGLYDKETKRALDGLFNVNFKTVIVTFPTGQTNPVWLIQQIAIRNMLLTDLPLRQRQIIVAMFWGSPYSGGHALMAVRHDNGRLFFKNPWYAGSNPMSGVVQGGTTSNPPRRYEDPSQALESIADADLQTWIMGYWVPDSVIL
jgi:hypothetical protein